MVHNLEDLYSASCPKTSFLIGLNLAPDPLWRPEQVEVTGVLARSQGTDGWTPWPMLWTSQSSYRNDIDIPHLATHTSTHTNNTKSLLLPQTDGYNLCQARLQSWAENNRFHWQSLNPLIKTLQRHHMKTSSHASIFSDLQHVIWDQLLWAHSLQSSPLSPPEKKETHTEMQQLYLSAIMTPISATTHDACPQRFSFQKVADPRIAGPFTTMTSLDQTVPTVLNKAQACFGVGVPLLHWDLYESKWGDLCTKLVMAQNLRVLLETE